MAAGVPFAKVAKKFRAKESKVLAIQHSGPPAQYPTEHGTETAYDGDYVVQVGEYERQQTIPPSVAKNGDRIPGRVETVKEPKLEVMKAEDFAAIYEPA